VQVDYVITFPGGAATDTSTVQGVQDAMTTVSAGAVTALMVAELATHVGSGTYSIDVVDISTPSVDGLVTVVSSTSTASSVTSVTDTSTSITFPLAIFQANDTSWSDEIEFSFADHRFARRGLWDGNTDAGSWSLSVDTLTLNWDRWGSTILTTSDAGDSFSSTSSALRLASEGPPDWWSQQFGVCTFFLTISREYGDDIQREVTGRYGDTFQIGSCTTDEYCSSNGWGQGFHTVVDQSGTEVGRGTCCGEDNTIVSTTSSCSQRAFTVMARSAPTPDAGLAGTTLGMLALVGGSFLLVSSVLWKRHLCKAQCRADDGSKADEGRDDGRDSARGPDGFLKEIRPGDEEAMEDSPSDAEMEVDQDTFTMDLQQEYKKSQEEAKLKSVDLRGLTVRSEDRPCVDYLVESEKLHGLAWSEGGETPREERERLHGLVWSDGTEASQGEAFEEEDVGTAPKYEYNCAESEDGSASEAPEYDIDIDVRSGTSANGDEDDADVAEEGQRLRMPEEDDKVSVAGSERSHGSGHSYEYDI
jgi:hypothetical protein